MTKIKNNSRNFKKNYRKLTFYLIYEEIGIKFCLGVSFILTLGFTLFYASY